jgi:hypothetical protein
MEPDRETHPGSRSARVLARDLAVRRTRGIVIGVAAGAVALSGVFSVVAAQAFKGHSQRPAPTSPEPATGMTVPGPDHIPSISGDPAPLQPPEQPPTAAPQTTAPAPEPQVSGGS